MSEILFLVKYIELESSFVLFYCAHTVTMMKTIIAGQQ